MGKIRIHYAAALLSLAASLGTANAQPLDPSAQRGLNSRAYNTGRLSVRREAGEHLFHRLLYADLSAGLQT